MAKATKEVPAMWREDWPRFWASQVFAVSWCTNRWDSANLNHYFCHQGYLDSANCDAELVTSAPENSHLALRKRQRLSVLQNRVMQRRD